MKKELIDYIKEYPEFSTYEISIINDLRILRNRVAYEGFFVEVSYLNRNENNFKKIIKKLKQIVNKKI